MYGSVHECQCLHHQIPAEPELQAIVSPWGGYWEPHWGPLQEDSSSYC